MSRAMAVVIALLLPVVALGAQDAEGENGLISMAILDLENRGGLETTEIEQISNLLRHEIIRTGTFDVVERERLGEILATQENQQSGAFDSSDAIPYGELKTVRQLVLGSAGKLFGRLVITVRLVSAETGRIIFAETLYTEPENAFDAVGRIAQGMAQKAVDYTREMPAAEMLDDIRRRVDRGEYVRASELLDAYVFQHGLSDGVRALRDAILPGLYDDYLKEAKKARRQSDYRSAAQFVGLAIAVEPTRDAYELRERILAEQEEHRQLQEELRRRAELERQQRLDADLANVALSPLDVFRGYYGALQTKSHRLSVVSTWRQDVVPEVPTALGAVGIGYIGIMPRTDAPDARPVSAESVGYLSASLSLNFASDIPEASAELALAPFSAISFRLLNFFITTGIDAGVNVLFSQNLPEGYHVAPILGARVVADLRLFSSLGAFLSVGTAAILDSRTAEQQWTVTAATGLVL